MNGSPAPPRRSETLLLVAILAIAAALRVFLALTTPGWFAELYIVRVAAMPLSEALRLAAADIHPPLQFLLRCLWTGLAGDSVLGHKIFSIVFSLASMVLAFALARRALGARAAFFMLALLAVNAGHVQYSQEIEEYSLEWMLVAAMAWFGWCWIENRRRRDALLYVVAAVLAAANHYESLPVIAFVALGGVLALVPAREPKAIATWIGWNALALVLFLPFVPVMLAQLARESGGRFFAFPSPAAIAGVWRVLGDASRFALFPMLALSVVPFVRRDTRRFATFVAPLVLLAPFSTRFWVVILPREVLFVLPLWLMLVGAGLASLPRATARGALFAALLLLGIRSLKPLPRFGEILDTAAGARALAPVVPDGGLVLHAEPHSLLYFLQYRPRDENRLLLPAGARVPFFEGGLVIPDSLYFTYDAWRAARKAGRPWWGVRVDRALATRGKVWRAGEAPAESLALYGDTLAQAGRVTMWRSRPALRAAVPRPASGAAHPESPDREIPAASPTRAR